MGFAKNWLFSSQFLPTMKELIGKHLLLPAPLELDFKQATDLVVMRARDMRIGCRIRRARYWPRFSQQFTMRSYLPSGAKTEFDKIMEGWGDWLFYGFALDDVSIALREWWLLDLDVFRDANIEGHPEDNDDGTGFYWWRIQQFPAELVIASSSLVVVHA